MQFIKFMLENHMINPQNDKKSHNKSDNVLHTFIILCRVTLIGILDHM